MYKVFFTRPRAPLYLRQIEPAIKPHEQDCDKIAQDHSRKVRDMRPE